LKEPQCQCSQ
jgi:hypothetical protein